MNTDKTICVVGLGYIGLPTASMLATKGYRVFGVDVNQSSVDMINRGEIPIVEPDLDLLVRSAVHSEKLTASTTPSKADIFVIAVPTPFKGDHKPDLSYIEAATKAVAPFVAPGNLIILESTSPVGTTQKMASWLLDARSDLSIGLDNEASKASDVFLAHCPERVLPGHILRELVENDRIVGGLNQASTQIAADFYATFSNGKILQTNSRTAEMAKLTENAFRDTNIAFANELSLICDRFDINVWELIELANRHPRVNILQPGPGVGGHCIAVDPWFIVDAAPEEARLIRTAREVNDSKPQHVIAQVLDKVAGIESPTIACLGLAFKANIDDLRESPAMAIVEQLSGDQKIQILAVEPHIKELPASLQCIKNVKLVGLSEALQKANLILLLVDHDDFESMTLGDIGSRPLIDTRGAVSEI